MKYKRLIIPAILVIALVATGVWGYNQYKMKNNYEIALNNHYQMLFYDLKDHVENVQVNLSKALLSGSKEQNVLLLSQIMQQAYMAEEKLGQMPVKHSDIAQTQKFLTQVSDYSFSLVEDILEGQSLNQKRSKSMIDLQQYTSYLSKELSELHGKLAKGQFSIGTVKRKKKNKLENTSDNMLDARLVKLEEKMTNYPELIYDGPFSDQVMNVNPKGLGNKKVDEKQARKIAADFIGIDKVEKLTMFEQGKNINKAKIPSYTFSIAPENKEKERGMYIGVSMKGGKVVWMENPRNVPAIKLNMESARKKAKEFLNEKGYNNMEANYSLRYDGVAVFNFAYKDNGVTIYPDLIKVKVALDNGEILGIDAAQYLKSHHNRDIPEPKLTESEAREKVRVDFEVDSVRLAIIPETGIKEVLCYEFKGKYQGSDFIVYINALTGKETKILKIIKNENGTLTF